MLNPSKVYKTKSGAKKALKAIASNGEHNNAESIIRAVNGGYQIFKIAESGPMEQSDEELETLWKQFQGVPGADGIIMEDWHIFSMGTLVSEIVEWFSNEYSEGLETLKTNAQKEEVSSEAETKEEAPSEKEEASLDVETKEEAPPEAEAVLYNMSDRQIAALASLYGAKILAEKADVEKANTWFAFSEIYSSTIPCNLPPHSLGGIMGGLINHGFIQFVKNGKEFIGKSKIAVCLTPKGIEAMQGHNKLTQTLGVN